MTSDGAGVVETTETTGTAEAAKSPVVAQNGTETLPGGQKPVAAPAPKPAPRPKVARKPRPAKPKLSRLEELRRALGSREKERDGLVSKIADTKIREGEAVQEALEKAPRSRAYGYGESAIKLQRNVVAFEKSLGNLDSEIDALQPMLREEVDRERERRLGEVRGSLHELGNKELIVWEQSAEIVDELLASWNAYREILEERSVIYQECIHSGVLSAGENENYRELQSLVQGKIRPANATIMSFVARILDVTLDPDGLGYRDEGGRPADGNRKLKELLPDKRSQLKKLSVGGGVFELR